MARRRRSTSLGEVRDQEQLQHRQPRRRRFPWFVLLLLVLGAALFFAPQIVTQTTLKDRLIAWALPPGATGVDVGKIQASWFAPIELNQVEVHDVTGQPLVSVAKVTTEKRLLDLVTNYKSLGTIHVQQPHLNLVVTESGSNLQEALASFVTNDESSEASSGTSSPVSVGLEITDGRIDVLDQVSQTQSAAGNINVSLQVPAANESALVLKLSADTIQGQHTGALNADVTWQPPPHVTANDLGSGQVRLKSNLFPLPILGPLLTRTVPDLRLDGQLDTDLTCSWKSNPDGPALHAVGTVGIRDALFAMASVLGQDELRSRNTTAELDASISQSQLVVERLHTNSELGQLAVTGSAPVAELLAEDLPAQLLAANSQHQLRAEGQIDLAALAAALPQTLRLRDGTNITDGSLNVVATSTNDPQGRRFSASASTDQLAGIASGQAVRWDQPVEVKLIGRPVGSQWIVDRFEANSQFLQVVGNGSLAQGQFQATGDLGVMLAEAQKFCDLGSLQMAGLIDSTGNWQTDANGRVAGKMEAGFNQFVMAYDDVEPWRENNLTLTGSLDGQLKSERIERVDQASATLVSGGDQLEVQLTNAVATPSTSSDWPLRASLRGNIETWLARMKPWVSTGGWNVTGAVQASAAGVGSTAKVALDPIEVNLTDVRAASGSQVVVDPLVKLNATARWDQSTQRVTIPAATVASSTLALRAQDVDVSLAPESFSATGATSFRTDLQRLTGWFADPNNPSTTVPQGLAVGSVRLTTTGKTVQFQGQGKVTDLVINSLSTAGAAPPAWSQIWHEAEVTVDANGTFDQPSDLLQLARLTVNSDAVQVNTAGNIEKLTSSPYANVQGTLKYDWQRVLDKVRQQVGPQVQIIGQHDLPFTLQGPLTSSAVAAANPAFPGQAPQMVNPLIPPDLRAELSLGWEQANVYGIVVGPQQIRAKLERGVLLTQPVSLAVANNTNSGAPQSASVTMAPRVELNSVPMMLVLDENTSAENIELTPELCSHWLKYVAPLIAGTASASGNLSARLTGARVPLTNPMAADLAGQLTIHKARVSPGPMAQQLLTISQQVGSLIEKSPSKLGFLQADKTWLDIQQQQIDFQMAGGRVYHRNLEFNLGEAIVRSHGWVGLDQTIALEADIPILDKWVEKEELLAGMRGKSVQIPIRGTFSQPKLDQRALANLSQQLIGSTAEQFIQGELQKGLQKLLGPK